MKIVLVLPSLGSGGLEKVITELTWYFNQKHGVEVYFVSLSKGELFYALPPNMKVFMPSFSLEKNFRPFFLIKLIFWLRTQVKGINPDILLSFGGKFNAFVSISVAGLPVRVFVSDRSRPSISYGWFLDKLNPLIYKSVTGIIAQTEKSRTLMFRRTGHSNIRVIGNPIRIYSPVSQAREKVILNVGRFIPTKHQELLVKYFVEINPEGWKVCFIGDGQMMSKLKETVSELGVEDRIVFRGEVSHVQEDYNRSSIFAFTSVSEGFPNVLAEAMAAGLACISFDCEAGPADLLDDGVNGFLILENEHNTYIKKLELLINDEALRKKFGERAKDSILEYSVEQIGDQYLDFFYQSLQ